MNNAPFYVGQKVVCVRPGKAFCFNDVVYIKKSVVYTVSANSEIIEGHRTIEVEEVKDAVWKADRFAPIEERSISIPASLKEQAEELISVKETIQEPEKEMA